jgi:hypothetical protein
VARTTTTRIPEDIPPPVDAHDGFDANEQGVTPDVETALANTVLNMQLHLGQCKEGIGGKQTPVVKEQLQMPGKPNFEHGGASGAVRGLSQDNLQVGLSPEARQILQATAPFAANAGL